MTPTFPAGPRARAGLIALCVAAVPAMAQAQGGEFVGRVLDDSSRTPIAGATVVLPALGRQSRTDSSGSFRFADLPGGSHAIQVRALGFREERTEVTVGPTEVVIRDIMLVRQVQQLAGTTVTAAPAPSARHAGFLDRKERGIGHFVTRDQLADAEGGRRRTGDLLSLVPGTAMKRSGSRAWVASSRATNQRGGCAFCRGGSGGDVADRNAGAPAACYMDVYLDGALVYNSAIPGNSLFDVNSLQPSQLEGIEVYSSASQVPVQFNRTAGGCGVIVLWTR